MQHWPPLEHELELLATLLLSGDKTYLAKTITLCESSVAAHEKCAQKILKVLKKIKTSTKGYNISACKVIGFSGAPGSGKSTLIDRFGDYLLEQKNNSQNKLQNLAILTIDPSSQKTGGSILGDKTRMDLLAQRSDVYIRSSSSKGSLGGLAPKTKAVLSLLKLLNFDQVWVETVGIGQSESEIKELSDFFVMIVSPGAGDDLQAMKRGVLELVDLVIVNKADQNLLNAAKVTQLHYQSSLQLLQGRNVPVVLASALERSGFDELVPYFK